MHETSPGQVEKHELSIRSDNTSDLHGATTKTVSDMDDRTVRSEKFDGDDSSLRIYDDPCELLDNVPIFRMPRSRSWFCCPSTEATTQSNSLFYSRCPDYPLVTEAPRIQFHTVGWQPITRKHRTKFSLRLFYFIFSEHLPPSVRSAC